ncbi:ATP-binding cassette domain-containing protein [Gordonia sp. PKS22-38]|uniref:Nickel import system ATP-binding protein NikD n=1 Tax=Gordonia prachuapensis TaxID=3115651 RepID=A0ABU7MQW5_9ACTN|nr:ATP-binding cassette domain-containing protein [Gordonia sp. PKS22-38]
MTAIDREVRARIERLTADITARRRWDRVDVRVLHDVDLEVRAGSLTALVGESGCGKSMIAAALTGLLPPGSQMTGAVLVDDMELTVDDPRWSTLRGRRIGLVPQSPSTSFTPVRTVGSQLDEVIRRLGGSRSAVELCRVVRLPESALQLYPHELSGGMAQRAAVAAALAGDPAILVADEPTSALDGELAADTWELFAAAADAGAAVLVITHDIETLTGGRCDSIAVMRAGAIVAHGTREALSALRDTYVADLFATVT